jgi:predicted dehydrogenase
MEPTKTVIIGAGARAIAFCKFIADNPQLATLIAIVDSNTSKAAFLNKHFNFDAIATDESESLIKRMDINAVLIATPDFAHVRPAIAALKSNKNVYIEKPLATTLEDCDSIIAAAHTTAACYLGFNLRHAPVYEKVHEIVREGLLGKITTIEANEWYYGGKSYFRRWNRLRRYSGGLWVTKACHDFDMITWIAGVNPISVYATAGVSHYNTLSDVGPRCRDCKQKKTCPDYYDINNPVSHWFDEAWRQLQLEMEQDGPMAPDICLFNSDKDTFDNGIAVIDYSNGIRATYTVNVLAARTTRQMRIVGTEGLIEADTENGTIVLTYRHTNKTTTYDLNDQTTSLHNGADSKILTDFYNICQKGGTPRSGLTEGRIAVQMALAATLSSDNKSVVQI